MMAFKAFNSKLQATMGKGTFQFEPGGTYKETECKCAHNGFHCAENPLDTLAYYSSMDARFFIVKAGGEVHQDGYDSRISCTELTLIKEIDRIQLAAMACRYIEKYPGREISSRYMHLNRGRCTGAEDFIIVRGKAPRAAGVKGAYLFLLKEKKGSREIEGIYPVRIDGESYRENTWYGIRGGRVCVKKN